MVLVIGLETERQWRTEGRGIISLDQQSLIDAQRRRSKQGDRKHESPLVSVSTK